MNELSKITAEHLRRCAIVYARQSSTTQVEHNRESTARQYELAERAARLGWRRDQVKVIDEDLGISGSGLSERTGFARMTAEVGLGQVGIVLGLEVSRLARNNADWYRLLDLCGLPHAVISLARPALQFSACGLVADATEQPRTQHMQYLRWVAPTYTKIHQVLTNPFYAGVYVYGRTQQTCYLDAGGRIRKRIRQRDREQWPVFIRDHHAGYIDWNTFEANQKRLAQNIRPRPHQSGGAVREGAALLQGLAVCGHCGRRLAVHYSGRFSAPGYHCAGKNIVNGRGEYCLNIGGVQIDAAVAEAFLAALAPAGLEASLQAIEQFDAGHETTLAQFRRDVERARYNAQRAERRYRAVDPENRLVARGLEAEWESALLELKTAESELSDREHARPRSLTHEERDAILALGKDLKRIWLAPTTSDRKELLRTLLDDVTLRVERDKYNAHLTLRWRGGLFREVNVRLPHSHPSPIRTADDTIDLLRRLAAHYPDTKIAGILNRQGRTTATGLSFTANRVSSLRTHWEIPCFEPKQQVQDGECMTIEKAARALGIAPSTLHRCLNDGFIAGEQITPGAPWRIRINDELRSRFVESAPEGYVKMFRAMNLLGVSRQTILQRVKRGELKAVHVYRGGAKGIRIQVPAVAPDLFDPLKKN